MELYSRGFGGYYESVQRNLSDRQISTLISKISDSFIFELGELEHIFLRGTNKIVGYVGNDSVELCFPTLTNLDLYKIPHKHLKRIFNSVKISK